MSPIAREPDGVAVTLPEVLVDRQEIRDLLLNFPRSEFLDSLAGPDPDIDAVMYDMMSILEESSPFHGNVYRFSWESDRHGQVEGGFLTVTIPGTTSAGIRGETLNWHQATPAQPTEGLDFGVSVIATFLSSVASSIDQAERNWRAK